MERDKALDMALGQIEKQFGKGSIMRMGENLHMQHRVDPDGSPRSRPRSWHRRPASRPRRRDLRTRVLR